MKEAAFYLAAIGAYSVGMLSLFRYVARGEFSAGLIIIATYIGYVPLAWFVLRRLWRLVGENVVSYRLRVPVQAACVALLFSPTFAACGAAAPIPFPLIMAGDLVFPSPACGQVRSFTPVNALYVVLPTWLVFMVAYAIRLYLSRRRAL